MLILCGLYGSRVMEPNFTLDKWMPSFDPISKRNHAFYVCKNCWFSARPQDSGGVFKAIGNNIGHFIEHDKHIKVDTSHSVARILIEIDLKYNLVEVMEIGMES